MWPFGSLKPLSYDLVVIDVPAPFDLYSNAGNEKSPAAQYDIMSWDEIVALPVGQLCRRDALVLNWCCAPSMNRAIDIMERLWGIRYVTRLTWRKVTRNGKVRWGPGYTARTGDETCLVGKVGEPEHKPFPSIFDGLAREHSRKPEEFYRMVEQCCPQLLFRADIFATKRRPGWEGFGRELGIFDEGGPGRAKQAVKSGEARREPAACPLFDHPGGLSGDGGLGGQARRAQADGTATRDQHSDRHPGDPVPRPAEKPRGRKPKHDGAGAQRPRRQAARKPRRHR